MAKNNNKELDKAMENLRVDLNRLQDNSKQSALAWVLPITTLLLLIFKCLGYISISWWWVFAPIWIPALLAVILGIVIVGLMALVTR